jgi:hypothetical protein
MTIRCRLIGLGGELDCREFVMADDDDSAEISEAIHSEIETWILAPGDRIEITQI